MTNFFDQNVDAFIKAADIISDHCIRFAGRRISRGGIWPFMVLMRAFSHCDAAVAAIRFEGLLQVEAEQILCEVEVDTAGRVRFYPIHD